MEYEPAEYQKLSIRQYAPRSLRETAEGKYWRRFQSPTVVKQFGGVTHLDFCQVYPFNLACTAATRVIVYDGLTRQVGRTFSRFKDTAYGGCFRSDGRLLVAGGQQGIVQVFDAGSRAVLRQLKGHQRAVHVARFADDKVHVLSGSDDVTVRWWDVTSGTQLARLDGHEDYVRAAGLSPANAETWATGGYDHSVRLWDVRAGSGGSSGSACTLKLDHGAPVEDLAFFPSGSLLVTAGGSHLCVWDLVGGGRLLKKLANFQKTVSTVRMSPMAGPNSSAAPRLLAGSLDGHVKVFELDTFKVTHVSRYPAPVLSLAISPDCGLLAVGMADGTLSIRKHARPNAAAAAALVATGLPGGGARRPRRERYRPRLTAANFRYFIRGQSEKAAAADFRVAAQRKAKLTPYDKLLRQFKYRGALDAALGTRHPEVAASVLEELAARGGLAAAIGGRDANGLLLLLRHVTKYITEPRYSRLLCGVAHRVLDAYAEVVGLSPQVDEAMAALRDRLAEELAVQRQLMELQGALEPLLAASLAAMAGPS